MEVFNVAYELYSRSDDREGFLMEILEELVEYVFPSRYNTNCALRILPCRTLRSILHFIEGYIQKGRFIRIITFVPKRRMFKRFRRMLADIMGRLNVCSASYSASCFHYTCRSLHRSSYLSDRNEVRNAPTDHVTSPPDSLYQ